MRTFSVRDASGEGASAPQLSRVAMVALAAMMPAVAHAVPAPPTVTLSPTSATNPTGALHTVTAQVTGVCAETTSEVDSDGEGTACTSDAQCLALDTGGADEHCDFSGVVGKAIGIGVVGGPNSGAFTTWTTVAADGTATVPLSYTSSVVGTDTIQGCLDVDSSGGVNDEAGTDDATDLAACIADSILPSGGGDVAGDEFASNQVTKTWLTVVGTVVLSPLTAVNPDNPPTKTHTVNAQVTGVERCVGGSNAGTLCSPTGSDCTGGTCTDPSGVTVGFEIVSGPNKSDQGWTTTNGSGIASLTYPSNGVAGVDSIQACLDGDSTTTPGTPDENLACSGGTNDGTACLDNSFCTGGGTCIKTVANCLADVLAGTEPDFASNTVTKRWDPILTLQNFDAVFGTFSTDPAFNPVGTTHTVQATIVGAAKICFNAVTNSGSRTPCTTTCAISGETCGIAGYPVFFGVLLGSQNPGDLPGFVNTDSSGNASKTYTDTAGAGVDTIQACVDADLTDTIPDDANFTGCLADYAGGATTGQADIPSNTVSKTWLSRFVTSGGKWTKPDKSWDSFGGVVGQKPGTTTIAGEWQETAHASKGGNVTCHWNTFPALNFSCVSGKCGTNLVDTVNFIAANGSCSKGVPSQTVTVTITDGFKKPDLIKVTGGTGAGAALNVNPPIALGTGNFTLHP
jgi:hypothetical protein